MGRLEKYRNIRRYRKRCFWIVFFSFLLAIIGILGADYSVNGLMTDTGRVRIISFNIINSQLEVCFMNMKFHIKADFLHGFLDFLNRFPGFLREFADSFAWIF